MEGLDQEFKLAIEETQELAGKAATYSLLRSGKPSKMDIKATQYYRFQVNQRIEHPNGSKHNSKQWESWRKTSGTSKLP